jgi:hypothetical protein
MVMSLRGYARHRGCRLSAIQRAIARGQIEKTPEGKIDSEAADRRWEEWAAAKAARRKSPDSPLFDACPGLEAFDPNEPMPMIPNETRTPQKPPEPREQRVSESEARRRKEVALATIRELEAAERAGSVIPVDQVEAAWSDVRVRIKTAVLRLPEKCAPKLVGLADAREARLILHAECEAILRNLSDDILRTIE